MANEANSLKAWTAPVVTAAYGYALVASAPWAALLGIAATIILGLQAAQYLRQERAFRKLYAERANDFSGSFDINLEQYLTQTEYKKSVFSWSIQGYFGMFAIVGLFVLVYTLKCR